MASSSFLFLHVLVMLSLASMAFADLSDDFYDDVCPEALPTIKRVVEDVVRQERRMGASLLRLHFHDCFVNGCDASILLDQADTIGGEKALVLITITLEGLSNLVSNKGLLHSDQALFSGGETDDLVKTYSKNLKTFSEDFAESMIKMGNIKPLTGKQGQIRVDCRKVN
ncbi:hypothetical protein K7X08_037894 [Anisodus acutangulus]|uniref:peroxidase n=1 Tax=Anisodus acutangulus TaxID=402998 RepID=A0A9Q1MXT8_9SOLA|nr:hypothetical protein K7X08_037894 [Anisodus acutangulus]